MFCALKGATRSPRRVSSRQIAVAIQLFPTLEPVPPTKIALPTPLLSRRRIAGFVSIYSWKITPKITLNLGLRWQYESRFNNKYGQQSQFSPTAIDPLTGRAGAILHPKNALAGRDLNNFQPRVGMAYNFRTNWVFRGGFAVNTLDLWANALRENLDEYLATGVIASLSQATPMLRFTFATAPPPIRFNVASDGSAPFIGANFSGRNASYFDLAMRMPYVMNWNGSIQ
jgi:hypothetical protein